MYRYRDIFPDLYKFQADTVRFTKNKTAVLLCAANRIGKTYLGTYIDAVHLMGDYPDDWDGHTFEHAPTCWLLGYSGEKTRDLLQTALFGRLEARKF